MSGSMSGERKRSVAAWPKQPRLSSTLPLCKALHSRELGARGLEIEPGLVIPLEFGELGELVRPVPGKPTIRFWRADAGTGRAPPRVSAEADLKSRSAAVSRPC